MFFFVKTSLIEKCGNSFYFPLIRVSSPAVFSKFYRLEHRITSTQLFIFTNRNISHVFQVSLLLATSPGSAQPNIDYYPINERVVFEEGETMKVVDIEIINDVLPEGPEEFFVNLTSKKYSVLHLFENYPITRKRS